MIQFKARRYSTPSLTPSYDSIDPLWDITITENKDFTWRIAHKVTKTRRHAYSEPDYVSMMHRIHLITQHFPVWVQV
jgi:hypothetical protein